MHFESLTTSTQLCTGLQQRPPMLTRCDGCGGLGARMFQHTGGCRCIAETSLILSGLNFNGYTDSGKARWDRYINTRIRKVEFCPSAAQLPQHWNICTGLFLRQCKWRSLWVDGACRAHRSLPQDSTVRYIPGAL